MTEVFRHNSYLSWLELVLTERFGFDFCLLRTERGLELKLPDRNGCVIFDTEYDGFNKAMSDLPCCMWDATEEGWVSALGKPLPMPGVENIPSPLIEKKDEDIIVHYDILGLTYWMLARIEEIGRTDLDAHQRFPAKNSHAFKFGYLNRPIIDEWLHILGQVIQRQFLGLELKSHYFQLYVSHDVDRPSRFGFANIKNLSFRIVGDVVRGNLLSALSGPWVRMKTGSQLHPWDRFNKFDWIMDVSESYGLKSSFNFICGNTSSLDADYDLGHPAIRDLLRKISSRGHEIGLHPSYNTFDNPNELKREAEVLKKVCAEEGIRQIRWGGRMHYLRWKHPDTLCSWANASMDYDSTLGYADHAGFRTGSCFEYPAYDAISGKILPLRIRPLIAMEQTFFNSSYMGLGVNQTLGVLLDLKNKCRILGGNFTLLWHNSELDGRKNLYKQVVSV